MGDYEERRFMGRAALSRAVSIVVGGLTLLTVLMSLAGCNAGGSVAPAGASSGGMTAADIPGDIGGGFPVVSIAPRPERGPSPKAGQLAPEFTLDFEDGRSLQFSDLRGRPVMVNFWATWCPPCRSEMPEIVRQAEDSEDLIVLAVNVNENDSVVRDFAKQYAMTMPVVMDHDGHLAELYLVRGMPTSVFIDREGVIVSVQEGMLSAAQLESQLAAIR